MVEPKARRQVGKGALRRELLPEQSPELLKALHLVTRDGRLNADTLRKLKQVNHLVGLLGPALDDAFERHPTPVLADLGSGNAYLGFVLYELFFQERGEVWCIETRPDLSARAEERAQALGYERMKFVTAPIAASALPERVHVLTALHACDTATDDGLFAALAKKVDHVAVVPCCQAEVARLLQNSKAKESPELGALFHHAWHRREFGSHLTNVLRALTLEAQGYQVTVTELTGWEHSLKNELILAKRVGGDSRPAKARLAALLDASGVRPKLTRLLAGES